MQKNKNSLYPSHGHTSRPRATSDQPHRPNFPYKTGRPQIVTGNMQYRPYGSYDSASHAVMNQMGGMQSAGSDMMADDVFENPSPYQSMQQSGLLSPIDMARNPSQHGSGSIASYPSSPYMTDFTQSSIDTDPVPPFMRIPQDASIEFPSANGKHLAVRDVGTTPDQAYREALYTGSVSTRSNYRGQQFSDGGFPTTPISEPDTGNGGYSPANELNPSLNSMGISDYSMVPGNHFQMQAASPDSYTSVPATAADVSMNRQPTAAKAAKKKEHWCNVPNCTHARAFGTRNDLERHKFSVHRMPTEGQKVYICQGAECRAANRYRQWPRKDNFKSHCKVAHANEDLDDLIRRSERISKFPSAPSSDQGPDDERDDASEQRPHKFLRLTIPESGLQPDSNSPPIKLVPPNDDSSPSTILKPQNHEYLSPTAAPSVSGDRRLMQAKQAYKRRRHQPDGAVTTLSPPSTSPGHDQALEALRTMSSEEAQTLIEYVRSGRQPPTVTLKNSNDNHNSCATCGKTFQRPCDLKKHKYRHTRPWGCTNETCPKRFGSKNDWKRHEHMLHEKEELWVCGSQDTQSPRDRCTATFGTADDFRQHISRVHHITGEQDQIDQVRTRRLGRQWARTMWCGFCRDVIKLEKRGLKRWEERFDHIDNHFIAQGMKIDDWYPPGRNQSKKELLGINPPTDAGSQVYDDSESGSDEDDDAGSPQHTTSLGIPIDPRLLRAAQPAVNVELEAYQHASHPPFRSEKHVLCCKCRSGTMNVNVQSMCPQCNHDSHDCRYCEQLQHQNPNVYRTERIRLHSIPPRPADPSMRSHKFDINCEVDIPFDPFFDT